MPQILTTFHVTGAPEIRCRLAPQARGREMKRSNAISTSVQACLSTGSSIADWISSA